MTDYWQYKAVYYWTNVVRNKEAFCVRAAFFGMAAKFLPREEAIRLIRDAVPEEVLQNLMTQTRPYHMRFDFNDSYENILSALWFSLTSVSIQFGFRFASDSLQISPRGLAARGAF